MGAFLTLIATCIVMFLAAMGAGMVPLHQATLLPSLATAGMGSPSSSIMSSSSTSPINLDAANLAVVSAVGAGLLISTALAVVVPEGFHLLAAIERKAAVVVAEESHGHESHGHESHDHHHSSHSSLDDERVGAGATHSSHSPAAFGLSATLASAGWARQRAKRGLLFFSLSSPVAALATFFALLVFGGGGGGGSAGTGLGVAAALLFSGGTLVHAAAVHVLPSVAPRLGFSSDSEDEASAARVRYALVAGAAAPLILSALAPHEH